MASFGPKYGMPHFVGAQPGWFQVFGKLRMIGSWIIISTTGNCPSELLSDMESAREADVDLELMPIIAWRISQRLDEIDESDLTSAPLEHPNAQFPRSKVVPVLPFEPASNTWEVLHYMIYKRPDGRFVRFVDPHHEMTEREVRLYLLAQWHEQAKWLRENEQAIHAVAVP